MLFHYYSQPTQATKLFSGLTLALDSLLCGYLSKVFDLLTHSGALCLIADPRVCKTLSKEDLHLPNLI